LPINTLILRHYFELHKVACDLLWFLPMVQRTRRAWAPASAVFFGRAIAALRQRITRQPKQRFASGRRFADDNDYLDWAHRRGRWAQTTSNSPS
jgi:hypothetical protein